MCARDAQRSQKGRGSNLGNNNRKKCRTVSIKMCYLPANCDNLCKINRRSNFLPHSPLSQTKFIIYFQTLSLPRRHIARFPDRLPIGRYRATAGPYRLYTAASSSRFSSANLERPVPTPPPTSRRTPPRSLLPTRRRPRGERHPGVCETPSPCLL